MRLYGKIAQFDGGFRKKLFLYMISAEFFPMEKVEKGSVRENPSPCRFVNDTLALKTNLCGFVNDVMMRSLKHKEDILFCVFCAFLWLSFFFSFEDFFVWPPFSSPLKFGK
jgi:hypothetical protein